MRCTTASGYTLLCIALIWCSFAGIAQDTPALPSNAATVRLETKDGQTHFHVGDLIELELVFSNPGTGDYSLNTTLYGDLSEKVAITPAGGWMQWRAPSGHDYSTVTKLGVAEMRIPVLLNDGFVFRKPGHYQVAITTGRLQRGSPLDRNIQNLTLTTNTVDLDLSSRSEQEEAALVRTLVNQIASLPATDCKPDPRSEAASRLAWLPGDAAVRAKVQLLLDDSDATQPLHFTIGSGLAASRDLDLQLSLLLAAWNNPQRTPTTELEGAIATTRHFLQSDATLPGWQMAVSSPSKPDPATQHVIDEHNTDIDRIIQSLPARGGDNRRDTAYFLIEDHNLTPPQLAQVKPYALDEFARMDPIAKAMLLETRWTAIRDPSLVPSLKAIIDTPAEDSDPGTALQRLIEMDAADSRPYVVKMVCSTRRGLLLDKLSAVREDRLPEVDACLSDLLRHGERNPHDFDWEQAAERAARFATPEILPAIKEGWNDPSQDAFMLAILLRDAPAEAIALLQKQPELSLYPANDVYKNLGQNFPVEMQTWLRLQLREGSGYVAGNVAYELSLYGEAADRALIEERLATLRHNWSRREADLRGNGEASPEVMAARAEEQNLVAALMGATAWKLTNEEKANLTAGCLSDWCRAYAPRKAPAAAL